MHPDKGAAEAIAVAQATGRALAMYGIVQDQGYYERAVVPHLGGSITHPGAVGGTERTRALGHAAALLHLINFDEPFGLSVVEAMACGTPVIAINRGSMPELIEDGVTGFLVDSVDERSPPSRACPRSTAPPAAARWRSASRSNAWRTAISSSTAASSTMSEVADLPRFPGL